MFISLLIANYNNEKYLDTCLKSVQKQTLSTKYFEAIIVDDCSTDKSVAIIKKYPFVKLIKLNKNIGLSGVRGKLIAASSKKATHIFFLDGDDFLDSHCLAELVKTTKENPNKIASCGTLKNNKLKSISRGGRISIINVTQHSKLWPKENLVNIKWPARLKNEDDYALPWALGKSEFIVNKKAIYHHRVVPNSLSTIKDQKNAKRLVDLALKNWPLDERNLALLHHYSSMEGAGRYFKKQCRNLKIKRPNFWKKWKWLGFKRSFVDIWTDWLF